MDYAQLGLRVGLEIHQRLDTRKLFCSCPSTLRQDAPPLWFGRRLRVSRSELGAIDPAAEFEQLRGRVFLYGVYPDTTCEIELDECPPLPIDEEALEIAIQISLLMKMEVLDEVHVMRKIVIDGSNTTGFQRTALIAVGTEGSTIETSHGPVRLRTICLEEESAFIVETGANFARYKLDRQGIPLVEIATEPDILNPDQAREAAFGLGRILRATGKMKRGIGTVRQDLNVSIAGGSRQEVKGVQELDLVPKIVEREARRQLSLLEIRKEMAKRGIEEGTFAPSPVEVTEVFRNTACDLVDRELSRGKAAFAVLLPKMRGLLGREIQPGRRFGTELSDYAGTFRGIGGILHTDELPAHGITGQEIQAVMSLVGGSAEDAAVIVLGSASDVKRALRAVIDRTRYAMIGIPEESRRPLPDGNSSFMRPLPGSFRMYPETDIPPIKSSMFMERAMSSLPEMPEKTITRLIREHGLSTDLAEALFDHNRVRLFETVARSHPGISKGFVASTLTSALISLRRDGIDVERLPNGVFLELFGFVEGGKLAKEAVPQVLTMLATEPTTQMDELVDQFSMTLEELDRIIGEKISESEDEIGEKGEAAFGIVMGLVMREARGKLDGSLVSRRVRKKLREHLEKGQK